MPGMKTAVGFRRALIMVEGECVCTVDELEYSCEEDFINECDDFVYDSLVDGLDAWYELV